MRYFQLTNINGIFAAIPQNAGNYRVAAQLVAS
jgi:hypothetical protein